MEGSQRNNRRHLAVEVLEDRTLLAASSLSSYLSLPSSLAAAVSYAAAHQPSAGPDLRELLLSEAAAAAGGRLLSADGHAMGYDRDALLDALFDRPGEERRTTLMDILNLPSSAEPRPERCAGAPERRCCRQLWLPKPLRRRASRAPSSGRVVDATGGIGLASRGGAPVDESAAPLLPRPFRRPRVGDLLRPSRRPKRNPDSLCPFLRPSRWRRKRLLCWKAACRSICRPSSRTSMTFSLAWLAAASGATVAAGSASGRG